MAQNTWNSCKRWRKRGRMYSVNLTTSVLRSGRGTVKRELENPELERVSEACACLPILTGVPSGCTRGGKFGKLWASGHAGGRRNGARACGSVAVERRRGGRCRLPRPGGYWSAASVSASMRRLAFAQRAPRLMAIQARVRVARLLCGRNASQDAVQGVSAVATQPLLSRRRTGGKMRRVLGVVRRRDRGMRAQRRCVCKSTRVAVLFA